MSFWEKITLLLQLISCQIQQGKGIVCRNSKETLLLPATTGWETVKKIEPDSSQRCTAKGRAATRHVLHQQEFWWNIRRKNIRDKCSETLEQAVQRCFGFSILGGIQHKTWQGPSVTWWDSEFDLFWAVGWVKWSHGITQHHFGWKRLLRSPNPTVKFPKVPSNLNNSVIVYECHSQIPRFCVV